MRDGSAQNIIQCLDRNIGLVSLNIIVLNYITLYICQLQETMDRINEITKNKNDKGNEYL